MQSNTTLQTLNLGGNNIGEVGANAIATCLKVYNYFNEYNIYI